VTDWPRCEVPVATEEVDETPEELVDVDVDAAVDELDDEAEVAVAVTIETVRWRV